VRGATARMRFFHEGPGGFDRIEIVRVGRQEADGRADPGQAGVAPGALHLVEEDRSAVCQFEPTRPSLESASTPAVCTAVGRVSDRSCFAARGLLKRPRSPYSLGGGRSWWAHSSTPA
jgi:hypothetical protein